MWKKKSILMDLSFGLGVNNSKLGGLIWSNGREGIYWQLGIHKSACTNLADGSNAKSTAILTWINSNFACRRYFKYIGSEPLNYTFFILVYYLFYGSTQIFIESCNKLFIVLSNLSKWQNKGKCTNCLSSYKSDIKLSVCKIISRCNVNYVVNLS